MSPKTNVHDLLAQKGSRKWVQLHVDSAAEAKAAEAAGIVILSCEADHTLPGIRAAAPNAMISAGMPHGTSATPDEAVRAAFGALRAGADAIYCSHSPRFIEAMAREGFLSPGTSDWCQTLRHGPVSGP